MWVRIAPQALDRLRKKLRQLTRRTRHGTLEEILTKINRQVVGWVGYYRLADTPSVFQALDEWLRRRLRQLIWKRWKRGKTRWRELVKLGVPPDKAGLGAVGTSPWRMAKSPVVNTLAPALQVQVWASATPTSAAKVWRAWPNDTDNCAVPDEPPDADPHVRWCERGAAYRRPPTRFWATKGCLVFWLHLDNAL